MTLNCLERVESQRCADERVPTFSCFKGMGAAEEELGTDSELFNIRDFGMFIRSTKKNEAVLLQSNSFFQKN